MGSSALVPSVPAASDVDGPVPEADRAPVPPARERWARILIRAFALATVVALLLLLVRLLRPSLVHWPTVVLGALNIPLSPSLVSVVTLLLLTGALVRRKRMALVVVAAFEIAGMLISAAILVGAWGFGLEVDRIRTTGPAHLAFEVLAVVIGLPLLWLTWWVRDAFPARTRSGAGGAAALTLVAGTAASVALTHLLLLAVTATAVDDWRVLAAAISRALGVPVGNPRYHEAVPEWIPLLTSLLLALTLLSALYVFLRPSRRNEEWSGEQEVALRALLTAHGEDDSLGYFATRRDKEIVYSPDARAAVAYRVVGGVSLASGDPVGDPSSWPQAVAAWKDRARRYGWAPAVLAASEAGARAHAAAGLAVTALGDEAVLHTDRFSLASTSMTEVRRAVRRAGREGLSVRIRRHAELPADELGQLGALAEQWRGNEPDRGFSMALNRWGDPADEQCVVVTAHRGEDEVVGLLSFVPWGRRGLSLDVMRRSPEAPNGTTEMMVAELMDKGSARGITKVSLNFAMFRSVFADAELLGAGGLTRMHSSVLGFFDRFFQLERLYRANAKYRPEWVPRYLCFDGALALARAGAAAGQAEGFLPMPFTAPAGGHRLDESQLRRIRALQEVPVSVREPRRSRQTQDRLRHARMLQEAGAPPYPIGVAPASSVGLVDPAAATSTTPPDGEVGARPRWRVHARVRAIRHHGGVVFLDLTDAGTTRQAVLERDVLGAEHFGVLTRALDTGDLVVVEARPGRSRNGTPSLLVSALTVVAKALHPVPFSGFEDPEARLRRRSTDLMVHPQALTVLEDRSAAITAMRRFLVEAGYREVETPMLATVHGGASARPFRTYINAYGTALTMRIAPELALKRLLVAGSGPIFEIGRNFRNEGADATHNPEFTSLEAYQPLADYHDMRELTERLIKTMATALHGSPLLPLRDVHGAGRASVLTDVSGPWPVVSVSDAVSRAVGRPVSIDTDLDELLQIAGEHEVAIGPGKGAGAVLEELYGELVEPATIHPTFYCDFPAETSPLTAPHRSVPGLVERWDLVANGMEIGTAYSELTDPVEQRRRLTEQSLRAAAGDVEAMEIDEDFLYALETGMPPAGGLGIGVDRLVMLLTDSTTIREVLTFPFVRPSPSRS
ncbi:bifunctional lysylphosphatidylglycerol synthetase/lysine--tRNA ligase LysX [Kocuria sp. CNJ-770]|uniref:bifunctional lysylphosphatidylglycerol synthetase/lysine--tRNA ligase LysX n=1 Tax=Kocuria sp. CNJ-770 TaxID=1904964 RepID=UPI000A790427|nr:bifunctional lysylphosphatidylglycerol synthetase/lysine--tRNA ligase LysX [Kocuria sp. CNJ-770]